MAAYLALFLLSVGQLKNDAFDCIKKHLGQDFSLMQALLEDFKSFHRYQKFNSCDRLIKEINDKIFFEWEEKIQTLLQLF